MIQLIRERNLLADGTTEYIEKEVSDITGFVSNYMRIVYDSKGARISTERWRKNSTETITKEMNGVEYYIQYNYDSALYEIYYFVKKFYVFDKVYPVKVIMNDLDIAEKLVGKQLEKYYTFYRVKEN